MKAEQIKRLDAQSVQTMPLVQEVKLALQANLAVIGTLTLQIDKLERCLHERGCGKNSACSRAPLALARRWPRRSC